MWLTRVWPTGVSPHWGITALIAQNEPRYCFHGISVLPLRLARRNSDRIQRFRLTRPISCHMYVVDPRSAPSFREHKVEKLPLWTSGSTCSSHYGKQIKGKLLIATLASIHMFIKVDGKYSLQRNGLA